MMESGTAIVEALLEGRRGIGLDIDPLAVRLSQVKSMISDIEYLQAAAYDALARVELVLSRPSLIDSSLSGRFSSDTKAFIDYWFFPGTQRELMAIVLATEEKSDMLVGRLPFAQSSSGRGRTTVCTPQCGPGTIGRLGSRHEPRKTR